MKFEIEEGKVLTLKVSAAGWDQIDNLILTVKELDNRANEISFKSLGERKEQRQLLDWKIKTLQQYYSDLAYTIKDFSQKKMKEDDDMAMLIGGKQGDIDAAYIQQDYANVVVDSARAAWRKKDKSMYDKYAHEIEQLVKEATKNIRNMMNQ